MKIILLFEGTRNRRTRPSVITRLSDVLPINAQQRTHLVSGSGTRGWIGRRAWNALTGADSFDILHRQYRWLTILAKTKSLQLKDIELFIFGFSRGAYQAQLFVDMFSRYGLPNNMAECASNVADYTASMSTNSCIVPHPQQPLFSCAIKYLGLIDAVSSQHPKRKWRPCPPLPVHICGRHALSLDEERIDFDPSINGVANLQHMWFAGVHSDVGWGYETSTLALIPMQWLLEDPACSVLNIPITIQKFPRCFMDMATLFIYYRFLQHKSRQWFWRFRGKMRRKVVIGNKHPTVLAVELLSKMMGIQPIEVFRCFFMPSFIRKIVNIHRTRKIRNVLYKNIALCNKIWMGSVGYSTSCHLPICLHSFYRCAKANKITCPFMIW